MGCDANVSPYIQPIIGTPAEYQGDSGCDIDAPKGTPVSAPCTGILIYSEGLQVGDRRHTPWVANDANPGDTPGCILMQLAAPLYAFGRKWVYFWFAHMSQLEMHIRDGLDAPTHIHQGRVLGKSGLGHSVPHLHFGILTDRAQLAGDYLDPFKVAHLISRWPSPPRG